MVRRIVIAQIQQKLADLGAFEPTDFEIKTSPETEEEFAKVTAIYRFEPNYYIQFTFHSENKIVTVEAPGELSDTAAYEYGGLDQALAGMEEWSDRMWEDLRALPLYRAVEQQQEQINEFLSRYENLSSDYFTREEGEELRRQLDQLKEQLANNIRESGESQVAIDEQLGELSHDIDILKEKTEFLNKRAMASSLFSRVWKWGQKPANQKMLGKGADILTKALLEATNNPQLPPTIS